MTATEAQHAATTERQAEKWRHLIDFVQSDEMGEETSIRIGAEERLQIAANDDGSFTVRIVPA